MQGPLLIFLCLTIFALSSNAITHNVDMPPPSEEKALSVDLNDRVELQCDDPDSSGDNTHWVLEDANGKTAKINLPINTTQYGFKPSSDSDGSILIIKSINMSMNQTTYQCRYGETVESGHLRLSVIPHKPTIEGIPTSVMVKFGSPLKLSYQVRGAPPPRVIWSRQMDSIEGGNTMYNLTYLYYPLPHTSAIDKDPLKITASNFMGVVKKSTTLFLYELIVSCSNTSLKLSGTIECHVTSYPDVTKAKLKHPDGKSLPFSSKKPLSPKINGDLFESVYSFGIPNSKGMFTVEISNGRANYSKNIEIISGWVVHEPTSAPSTEAQRRPVATRISPTDGSNITGGVNKIKGSSNWWIYLVVVLVCLVVIAVGVVIVVYFIRKRKAEGSTPIITAMELPETSQKSGPPVSQTIFDNPTYPNGTRNGHINSVQQNGGPKSPSEEQSPPFDPASLYSTVDRSKKLSRKTDADTKYATLDLAQKLPIPEPYTNGGHVAHANGDMAGRN
eukprot:m.63660 g.63660  ORF g.63660 m.63660 type:complete len:503 (+) comp35180_c1_seq1:483-1991(+)